MTYFYIFYLFLYIKYSILYRKYVILYSDTVSRIHDRLGQLTEVAMFVGKLTHEAGTHIMSDGTVARDSQGVSARFPLSRGRKARTQVPGAALRPDQCALLGEGSAQQTVTSSGRLPRELAQASGCRVASGVSKRHSKQRKAKAEAEQQEEVAFQAWWHDNRALRVCGAPASRASGEDRLAAVRSRLLARGAQ